MKTKLLVLAAVLFFTGADGWAQKRMAVNSSPAAKAAKSNKRVVPRKSSTSLFTIYDNPLKNEVDKDIKNALFLKLDFDALSRLNTRNSPALTLELPLSANSSATFYLHPVKLLSDDFKVVNDKNEVVPYTPGLYYQGTVAGNTPSLAAWSFFESSVMTVFSWNNDNYNLGVWKHPSNVNNDIYILYRDSQVQFSRSFECHAEQLKQTDGGSAKSQENDPPQSQFTNCIKIYFECDYQMYLDNGNNTTNVANFVTGMFNSVKTIYTNENVGVEISEIYTWTVSDQYVPYTTSDDLLSNFISFRTVYNGDVAHLLTTRNLNVGGLAYLDVLCSNNTPRYGVSNIDNTYIAYPTYSWTIEVVTHELGHNFGSNHTQWCGWVGGALDDCYPVEPDNNNNSCSPGPTLTNGGTIMSYCHLGGTGILLTNGFGTQPGNAIRAAYNAASCLSACTPTDPVCANSTSIPGCGSANAQTFNGGGTGSWNNNSASACGSLAPGSEKVYTFVAPSTGNYSIQVTAASGNMHYGWKTAPCGPTGWTCIGNINATGQFGTMSWTAGTTYYIMLDDQDGTTGAHTFYINCPPPSGPCASATAIAGCGSANTQSYTGGGSGSWYTSTSTPCGYDAPGVEKVYSFVAPTTGTYSIQITAATGYVDYLYQASSCAQTGWTCIEDTNAVGQYGSMSWTAGTTYYILLDDEMNGGNASSHSFYINCPVDTGGSGSDPCSSVIAITNCGTNGAQTFAGDTVGVWNSTVATVCGYSAPGKEQVYSFTAPTTGTYSVNISAATGYVDYFWRAGTCDSLGWTCIVDTNVTGQFGTLNWTAGTTYYILLDDEALNGASSHSFYITCADTNSSNDPCANAITISNCGPGAAQTFTGGGSGQWNTSAVNSCNHLSPGTEQVYSFVAPSTGTYSINVTAASGYVGYQWKASSCSNTGWSCIGNINATGLYGSLSWTAGTTYYIVLDDENSTTGTHTFYIECVGGSNPCTNATAITSCGANSTQTYTGGGSGAWNTSSNTACGFAAPGAEAVYTFAPATSGTYSIQVTAASGKVDYLWKAASCTSAGWTCIDDIDTPGQYGNMTWNVGTTYYILLDDENSTTGTHSFYINCANSPSGIDENAGATGVSIYPNPNTGSFTVSIAGNTQESIEIDVFNVLGEDVFKSKAENVNGAYSKEITLSTIAKGIYTVRIKTGSKLYHKKIIVE
jgi:hypothetical protein